jgi:hypothetical protein
MPDLQLYQVVLFGLSLWLAAALALQLPLLIRAARDGIDWQVVAFRGALLFLSVVVAVRYVIDFSPWSLVVGWLVLDLAASANTLYIWSRTRDRE